MKDFTSHQNVNKTSGISTFLWNSYSHYLQTCHMCKLILTILESNDFDSTVFWKFSYVPNPPRPTSIEPKAWSRAAFCHTSKRILTILRAHGSIMASQGAIRVIKIRFLWIHDIFKFEESAPFSYTCRNFAIYGSLDISKYQ